jgi:hypothetical protein
MNVLSHTFTKSSFLRLILICAVMAALAIVNTSAQAQSSTFLNPLNPNTGSDPWMTYYNGNYYLATTTFSSSSSVGLTMKKAPHPGLDCRLACQDLGRYDRFTLL